jgi:hypothetical protein
LVIRAAQRFCPERRTQTDIDREHAADPDDGADVQGERHGGHERALDSEGRRLHAGLCGLAKSDADVAVAGVGAELELASAVVMEYAPLPKFVPTHATSRSVARRNHARA